MSQLNVNTIKNRVGNSGPTVDGNTVVSGIVTATAFVGDGSGLTNVTGIAQTANIKADTVNVTGVVTATTFDGNVTGDLNGNVTGNVTGDLTGNVTGNVTGNLTGDVVGNITGVAATFSGDVSIGGTLTYEDVTNVDSVGLVTARTGVRVTTGGVDIAAGGLTVTGIGTFNDNIVGDNATNISGINSVTATAFYGDGSNLTNLPESGGTADFVASGTISNGDTVVINTDGTVSAITETGSESPSVTGSDVFANEPIKNSTSIVYDSTNNKVIVVYEDDWDGDTLKAAVGTVSGGSINFGLPVRLSSNTTASSDVAAAYDSSNQKVVIAYNNAGSNGRVYVCDVSGNSINSPSSVVYTSSPPSYNSIVYDSSNNKVVIVYGDNGNGGYGTAVVGTVSGTSISFGTPVVFESADTNFIASTFDSNSNKVVIAYSDNGNSNYGTAVVGTVSGTSISFGTPVVFESADTSSISATFDSNSNKVVIGYRDEGNSSYGTAVVGTVSGTSISFGTPVVFNSDTTVWTTSSYDSANNKVVIAYRDGGNSNRGTAIVGTVSGTSISFGSSVLLDNTDNSGVNFPSSVYDPINQKAIIVYEVSGIRGVAYVFDPVLRSTNLTTKNYIGIAAEAISDGATGKINVAGGVNSGQTGLTTAQTYYVQNDGTLSLIPIDQNVVAGTSVSATELIVKG